ncbi:Nipped-B-like protein [Schistosoma japonicum]|uniref:Nipped-B protein n=1 Tax=Schistosoma japonicum TaxID=6182 RepID=A0A4Z2CLK1_SCHJA|nr:Nipped-B-like protein [Schistosoma japonicum]
MGNWRRDTAPSENLEFDISICHEAECPALIKNVWMRYQMHSDHEEDSIHGSNEPNSTIALTNDFTGTTGIAHNIREVRSGATNRSYAGMDDEDEEVSESQTYCSNGSLNARRRKKLDDDEPFEVRLKEPIEARFPHIRKAGESIRKRRERVHFGMVSNNLPSQRNNPRESIVGGEMGSVKRFLYKLSTFLESVEETDILKSLSGVPNSDNQLRKPNHEDGYSYADKDGLSTEIPTDRLLNFLSLLLLNIRDGANVIAILRPKKLIHMKTSCGRSGNGTSDAQYQFRFDCIIIDDFERMPREVYVEDVIERVVHSVRFQLFNCIYPEFDAAYRVKNAAKENQNSIKSRRARERDAQKPKSIIHLYHKLVEIVSNLSKLVKMQRLTDSLILTLSSIGVSVFFVENVNELQLAALELVTAIFAQYETHRKLIMEEILAGLSRLPSSKKNLRSYKLNSEDSIQMLTALALLLVQSVVCLPDSSVPNSEQDTNVFLSSLECFLLPLMEDYFKKGIAKSTMKGEDDYRIIFENFVNDLLLAVNKTGMATCWYNSSITNHLIKVNMTLTLFVRYLFEGNQSDKDEDDSDGSSSRLFDSTSTTETQMHRSENGYSSANTKLVTNVAVSKYSKAKATKNQRSENKHKFKDPISQLDRVQALRDAILDYLAAEETSPTAVYARKFYLAQWLNDCTKETERAQRIAVQKNQNTVLNGNDVKRSTLVFQGTLDYEDCCLVCRYLASLRPFSQSFDVYLSQICKLLSESSVAVRTKALRCLSAVVEVDPNVLARADIERAVHSRLLAQRDSKCSNCHTEAQLIYIGRFLVGRPDQISKSYLLKICVKMMRRVNEEEGIRRTVKLTLGKVMKYLTLLVAFKNTCSDALMLSQKHAKPLIEWEPHGSRNHNSILEEKVEMLTMNVIQCLQTLHLLTSKIRPELWFQYLCTEAAELMCYIMLLAFLEATLPLMEHPSETFVAQLEEDMVRLTLRHGRCVLESCVCISQYSPFYSSSLFMGLLCKHFERTYFKSSKLFETLMFFTEQFKTDIENEAKPTDHQLELKCIVLENLLNFFLEEEKRMLEADSKCTLSHHQESLKEMGDVASGIDILESFFSPFFTVRLTALSVITTILRQGLVHPVQTVPYLIAMQSDIDPNIRIKADTQLQEIDIKFPGFLTCSPNTNISGSRSTPNVLEDSFGAVRGTRDPFSEIPSALNSHLYLLLRNNKSQRRSLLNGLISLLMTHRYTQEEPLFVVHHIDLMVSMAELKVALEVVIATQLEAEANISAQTKLQLCDELQAQQVASTGVIIETIMRQLGYLLIKFNVLSKE